MYKFIAAGSLKVSVVSAFWVSVMILEKKCGPENKFIQVKV
mgnify:CR=1 FL=1